ncbi:MAG: lipid A biosynthesis acyltransferase [Alphaproteobacteria bacterium]|nr:lipid A biosynthesis acyltransferase [Alphaproteobacteria bacterium]
MKKIRHIIELSLLYVVLGISKILPPTTASNLGGAIGRFIGPFFPATARARENIKRAMPEKTATEITEIVSGMWDNLGRVLFEYSHLETLARDYTDIKNIDILKEHHGKPVILFAAHLGNWEIAPPSSLTQHNMIVNSLYRAPNNPYVDKLLLKIRSLNGRLCPIPKSKSGTKQLFAALKQGQHIGFLVDQKYNEGLAVPFMDMPAMTSAIFVQMAQKLNCPLVPIRFKRTTSCHFEIELFPPLETQNKSVEELLVETHGYLEEWIKDTPDQWLWLHRRWNSKALTNDSREKEEHINDTA